MLKANFQGLNLEISRFLNLKQNTVNDLWDNVCVCLYLDDYTWSLMVSAVAIFLPEHYVRLWGQYRWSLLLLTVWQSIYFLLVRSVCSCACAYSIHRPTVQAKQRSSVACYLKKIWSSSYTRVRWRFAMEKVQLVFLQVEQVLKTFHFLLFI